MRHSNQHKKNKYPYIYLRSRDEDWDFSSFGDDLEQDLDLTKSTKIHLGNEFITPKKGHFTAKKDWDYTSAKEYVKSLNATHKIHTPRKEHWEQKVENLISIIKDPTNIVEKVVLAASTDIYYEDYIDPWKYFLYLMGEHGAYKNYFFYYELGPNKAFISCSPEKLFSMKKAQHTHLELESLAASLLTESAQFNLKEVKEQEIVTRGILEALESFAPGVQWNLEESILALKHLKHKKTKISGVCGLKNFYEYSQLLELLAPTAAIVGYPKKEANLLVKEFEPKSRDLYSSPIGIIHKDFIEYFVGIRSCLIDHHKITFYGGAGITHDSCPVSEWEEIQRKMQVCQAQAQ